MQTLPGFTIPDQRRLALIGDADRGYFAVAGTTFRQCLLCHIEHGAPNCFRIVLDPSRFRRFLWKFLLGAGDDGCLLVKDYGSTAVRSAVHGEAVKNTDALANPEALQHFRDLTELTRA